MRRSISVTNVALRASRSIGNGAPTSYMQLRSMHIVKDSFVDKTPITALLWQMRQSDGRISENDNVVSDASRSMEARTSDQSRIVMRYSFSSDSHLRDLYVDHTGNILTGKLLEDLDALAGNVANKHCCDENLSSKRLSLVTASVDEIIQSSPIPTSDDLVLTGIYNLSPLIHLLCILLYPPYFCISRLCGVGRQKLIGCKCGDSSRERLRQVRGCSCCPRTVPLAFEHIYLRRPAPRDGQGGHGEPADFDHRGGKDTFCTARHSGGIAPYPTRHASGGGDGGNRSIAEAD